MSLKETTKHILPAFLIFNFAFLLTKNLSLPFPAPNQIQMPPSEAVQDMIFLSLGMRRLASDIGFIRLMEYYGTPEESSEGHS
ncbi:MAG: hypothetical protein HY400_03135, partial [Elusimicrobia bacterium]|nr:hypothetical protein [Elusimicrobiota bacterium]